MNYLFSRSYLLPLFITVLTLNSEIGIAQIINDAPFVLSIDELKDWTPEGPTADSGNISNIPLAAKFIQEDTQLNPLLTNDMEVMFAPDGMANLASYLEEQSKFNLYNFTHWSYIDQIVWFGGTSVENVQIPSAPWVDTAHRNGVKVYGNIFFAPTNFGGTSAIVSNFLEQDADGNFIAAQKMLDISSYYQFDGWFINMETSTTSANGQLMREFVEEMKSILPDNQELIWYDSMLINGNVNWQNQLNSANSTFLQDGDTRVSDGMFINFFWDGSVNPNTSRNTAQGLGRSEFEVYTGVDLWPTRNQAPFETGGNEWMGSLHSDNTPITSLGLFVPNALFQNDVYSSFNTIDTEVERERFYSSEKHMFGGLDRNPEIVDVIGFRGLSNWIPATSVVSAIPFTTSFNTGHGRVFAEDGAEDIRDWHDIAKQDILPTWQFATQGTSDLDVNFDFTKAYNGGTSLSVEGDLVNTGNTTLKLYKTQVPVSNQTKIDLTYQLGSIGETNMEVVVAFSSDPTNFIPQSVDASTSSGWNINTIDLSAFDGEELAVVGLRFSATTNVDNYKINIGELKIFNGTGGDTSPPIANFDVDDTDVQVGELASFSSSSATGAVSWSWSFPGGSPDVSSEENPTIMYDVLGIYDVTLVVTNANGSDTEIKTAYINVNNNPTADFTEDTTILQVGESVNFTNTSTNDSSWSWSFPGGTPSSSTDQNPTIAYNTVGTFDVSLTAINADGNNTITKMNHIDVIDNTGIDHTDPVGTGIITARAEINEAESKEKAFDNLAGPSNFTKWLDNDGIPSENDPSWIQIQFPNQEIVNILTLVSPNDAADRDPEDFRLLGSNNGVDYIELQSWTAQFFTDPFAKKILPFSNTDPYAYYRLEVTKNRDNVGLTQIAEIELIGPETLNVDDVLFEDISFKLYPNPAKNFITLDGEFPVDTAVEVVSLLGNRVLTLVPVNSSSTKIDLSQLSAGVYLVMITNENNVLASTKIVVE